jgi:hypothetical protein
MFYAHVGKWLLEAGADSWTLLMLQFVPRLATAIGYRLTLGFCVNHNGDQVVIGIFSSLSSASFYV